VIGPTLVPVLEVPTAPFHPSEPLPPLAVQAVAPKLDHDSEVDCPTTMVFGNALKEVTLAAGGGALVTLTMAELLGPVPPGPVQVSV
jgi:hypothetical protein